VWNFALSPGGLSMSARKSLPIGIIVMILMMALAALGVGYAWWTEQLTTTGTIQTGSINVKLENATTSEFDPLDVASCSTNISGDGKSISVVITDAYPAYTCSIKFNLINVGTIPAKITNVNLPVDNDGYGVEPSGALVSKPVLAPGKPEGATFFVRVKPGAAQSANYQFDFSIEVTQGNAP
jgi:predicted ribosomally synthesized peptide with SipW-like signal peptide